MSSLREAIVCSICKEVMFQPASVSPCMHTFCSPCISDWSKISKNCPFCKTTMNYVSKHHLLANIVDNYLIGNPSENRTAEEIAELQERNLIKDNVLTIRATGNSGGVNDYEDDEEEEMDESEESVYSDDEECMYCRPNSLGFQCGQTTRHCVCRCGQKFPIRSDNPTLAEQQQCIKCKNMFCQGCTGSVLKPLKEFDISFFTSDKINRVEMDRINLLLRNRNLTFNDILRESCTVSQLENKYFCNNCANEYFETSLLEWRKNLLNANDFPVSPDCWWGIECRTQYHKQDHALKYNHICQKSRNA